MNDDDYGFLLLRPLREEPSGPPAIDVVRAMREGRRMRRRRWWTGGSALAATLVAALTGGILVAGQDKPSPGPDLPPDPILPAACTAGTLPMGRHTSAEVTGGDPSGAWLVGVSEAHVPTPGVPHSILVWHDGKLVADVTPPDIRKGSAGVRMGDINASGVAVGGNSDGYPDPYVLAGGKARRLAGGRGEAVAINDAGVIAGQVGTPGKEKPVRWRSPDAQPEPLPLPAGIGDQRASVVDIAPDGTIVGEVEWRAYLWRPDGTGGYLDLPKVGGREANGFMPMVFGHGWLYGTLSTPVAASADPGLPLPGAGRDTMLYRYELRSGTWQELNSDRREAQVAGTKFGQFMAAEPKVFAGRSVLSLPAYAAPVMEGTGNFVIENVSDDVRVVAGTVWSGNADPSKPAVPIIWRCR
ncbi:hypothetical protein [Actinoplanes sp. URMC 104]|uniref:hypothetical protein n=1 Tax=Actinoplanes sp. URMC 104 TaxID=3423409 RepID=UPI003F1B87EF